MIGGRDQVFLVVMFDSSAVAVRIHSSFPPNRAIFHTMQFSSPLYLHRPPVTILFVLAVLVGVGTLIATCWANTLAEKRDLMAILYSTLVADTSLTTAWILKGREMFSEVRYLISG